MLGEISLNAGDGTILSAHSAMAGWDSPLPDAHSLTLFCHLQFWAAHAERTWRGFLPYCCWLASPYCCLHAPSKSPSFMNVALSPLSMLLFPFVFNKPSHLARCAQCYSSFSLTSPGLCLLSLLSFKSLFLFSQHHPGGNFFPVPSGLLFLCSFVPSCSCVMSCLPMCFWGVCLLVL